MNHAHWMKKVKTMTISELQYVIKDCTEAITANPDNPKCSEYTDIKIYCGQELRKRNARP